MPEYTPTFAKFILSARKEYDALCERIAAGEVPAAHNVIIRIEIPADDVDRIRFDLIADQLTPGADHNTRVRNRPQRPT